MLGLSVHDVTAGYRAYHRDQLARVALDRVRATATASRWR